MTTQIHNEPCEFCKEREALYVIPGPAGVMKACTACKERRRVVTDQALRKAS